MKLVPVVVEGKKDFYERVVRDGGEGVMLKDSTSKYTGRGRPKSQYKAKRFEEIDAFVSGFLPGDEDSGWRGLVGSLEFSCYTKTGKIHSVAFISNVALSTRKQISICAKCGTTLNVKDENIDGKRRVTLVRCDQCDVDYPEVGLHPAWLGRCGEIRGQEYTARVYRLKHATLERWRMGVDGKSENECVIDFENIRKRFEVRNPGL